MRGTTVIGVLAIVLAGCGGDDDHAPPPARPNILFVVMDDVGIDQMATFGYGGETPPSTPDITAIADAGLRFRNAWAMPACTTSRAVFFDARFPLRTNVKGALGPDDLANSMVSPYEVTAPKLLAEEGYESALFGKFHLGLQGNDPAGLGMPANLGWDYFAGWLDETGDPSSIDTTAGGVAPIGTWACGFVGPASAGGADRGACYFPDDTCIELKDDAVPPGRLCRDRGGIFDPAPPAQGSTQFCRTPRPAYIDFSLLSGHYVSPLVYNRPGTPPDKVAATDPRARQFRARFAVDAAIEWINDRPADAPWMATVSFASDHTPLMQPPYDPDVPDSAAASALDCANALDQRVLSNLMIESLDRELGRLLVATGLARRGRDGRLVYRPGATDTMIIVVGDNGSLGTVVKLPFDSGRAKGTAYQTGVWVPLVVAGPLVERPGRDVPHMVNVADLFALFGEIAGIDDVAARVPRPIDAVSMLPYLTNPRQESLRTWNYTEVGVNLQANGAINAPCVISGACTQIPVTQSVCEDNNGVWWGKGHNAPITDGAPEDGFRYCCEVNQFVVANQRVEAPYNITPLISVGIRNARYKIVENAVRAYVSQDEPCREMPTIEFFEIDEAVPVPKIDRAGLALPLAALTPEQQQNFDSLRAQLAAIRASVPDCPGDGNADFVVDQTDLANWQFYADGTGGSSWYDINLDGVTDALDEMLIADDLGIECSAPPVSQ